MAITLVAADKLLDDMMANYSSDTLKELQLIRR